MNNTSDTKGQQLLMNLMNFYEKFSTENLAHLYEFYTQDIEFVDPVHKVDGILSLKHYFKKMAVNLSHYKIRYLEVLSGENSAYLTWEMDFAHKKICGGKMITVRGMSHLKFTNRIFYHEDCYDMGALLYKHLPVIGGITRTLKGRMAAQGN